MFKDYSKGIKYASVNKKKKRKNKTKCRQGLHTHPPRSQMIFLPTGRPYLRLCGDSEGKLWDDLLRGVAVRRFQAGLRGSLGQKVRPPDEEAPASSEQVVQRGGTGRAAWGFRVREEELSLKKVDVRHSLENRVYPSFRGMVGDSVPVPAPSASFYYGIQKDRKKKREKERRLTSIWVSCIKWETAEREETRSRRGGTEWHCRFHYGSTFQYFGGEAALAFKSVSPADARAWLWGRWWLQHGAE